MAKGKAKAKTKPARKAARKPAPKAAAKRVAARKPAPKAPAAKVAATKVAAPKVPAPKLPPQWSAAQRSEFEAIRSRAKALSAGLKRTDFDSDGNPVPGPWASMLADLDAWARKHKVKLETHEHDHAPAAGGAAPAGGDAPAGVTPYGYGGDCPGSFTKTERKKVYGTDYIYNYSCTLKRQTVLGRCVYNCALDYTLAS
jgi:hypothetical protein